MIRTNEEIELEFQKLELEKEDFMREMKKIKSHLESEEWEDRRQYNEIANMREACSAQDSRMIGMLEELEENLRRVNIERHSIMDSLIDVEKKKRLEWNILEERLCDEQARINEQENEDAE